MKLAIVDDNKLEQELIFNTHSVLMNMKETSPLIFLLIVMVILF